MLGTPIRFDYTGSAQTYTVPADVVGLVIDCVGACGKDETYGNETKYGGNGGRVQCVLSVTSGDSLYLYVGNKPTSTTSATYNASDIRTNNDGITNTTSLSSRLVVAGGGGSAGVGATDDYNRPVTHGGAGGAGGELIGAKGTNSINSNGIVGGTGGSGGTQTAGGSGGSGAGSSPSGSFGLGGFISSDFPSGQGGAGWYGGGAGGGDLTNYYINVGGGGGGSSYTDPTLCTEVTHTQGYSEATGNGWIILTPIYSDICTRDSSKDKVVSMSTTTYEAFIAAGYKTDGSIAGVYLKDLNQ